MKMNQKPCAYCGRTDVKRHKGHVIAESLYIDGIPSTAQGRTVAECEVCKEIWTDSETLFRNAITCAGNGSPATIKLWNETILPSFDLPSGPKWFRELNELMTIVETPGGPRIKVFPDNSSRVRLVVRKIIRGLSAFHKIAECVPDLAVRTSVLTLPFPEYLRPNLQWHNMGKNFVEYGFERPSEEYDHLSSWYIKFYGRCEFIAIIDHKVKQGGSDSA